VLLDLGEHLPGHRRRQPPEPAAVEALTDHLLGPA
jgi:hypothetical protein